MDTDNGRSVLAPAIVLVLELAIGLGLSIFIIAAIFFDFNRQKTMSNSNKIMLRLSIWSVNYLILTFVALVDQFICLRASSRVDFSSVYIIFLLYSISSCGWSNASLGVFYFITISQVKILSGVKFRISAIVPWALLVLEVVSFINSVFGVFLIISPWVHSVNMTDSSPCVTEALAENKSGLINAALLSTSIPFIFLFFSILLTIWTLKRHSQKMGRNMDTVDSGRLTPYERVVRRITFFLSFNVNFYIVMLIFYFSIIAKMKLGFLETLLLLSSFPPLQSVLLILSNPRFKDAWKEMLLSYKCICGRNEG